jgi:imidazolonepropionase-like amidohydrolase
LLTKARSLHKKHKKKQRETRRKAMKSSILARRINFLQKSKRNLAELNFRHGLPVITGTDASTTRSFIVL